MTETTSARTWAWLRADPRRFDLLVAIAAVGMASLLILGAGEEFDTGWPEVAAGIGAFAMLLGRRWQPLVLLPIALVSVGVHVVVWNRPTPMLFAALVLLSTAAVRLERRPALALGLAVAVSLYIFGILADDLAYGDARAVIGIAWTAGAIGVADAVRSWRRYRESSEAQVRTAVLAAEAQARQQVSEERLTIARELHDLLAHNLSVMNVQTGAALHLLRSNPDAAEESLTAARDAGKTVLSELSELLAVLRHEGEEAPTSSLPTIDQLGALVDTMRSAGLDVTWSRAGAPRTLAPAVSLAGYRIAQEALTNAAKHGAGTVELATDWHHDGVTLRITNPLSMTQRATDDADQQVGTGHGVIGMRERAVSNGGRFDAGRNQGQFSIEVWLPAAADRQEIS